MRRMITNTVVGLAATAGLLCASLPAQAATTASPLKVVDGVIQLANGIMKAVQKAQTNGKAKDDRGAFVQQLLLDVRDDTKGQYNVLICSEQAACDVNIEGGIDNVDYQDRVLYDSPKDDGGGKADAEFADTVFRIWVFDDAAKVNTNGRYGWHNWGMYGVLKDVGGKKGVAEFGRTSSYDEHEAFDKCDTNDDGDKGDPGECDAKRDDDKPQPGGGTPAHGKAFALTADNGTAISGKVTLWQTGGGWQIEENNGGNTGRTSQAYPDRNWLVNWGPANAKDPKQLWVFEPAGGGWYKIRNVYAKSKNSTWGCLTPEHSSNGSFASRTCDRGDGGGQRWKLS